SIPPRPIPPPFPYTTLFRSQPLLELHGSSGTARHGVWRSGLELDLAAQRLDGAALCLVVDPLALGAARGAGRPADFLHHGGGLDQLHQPGNRVVPVLFLGPMALGLDHYYPILADTVIPVLQQARLAVLRQARGTDIEAQMDGAGDLVDVLASGPLGTDGHELQLLLIQ